MSIRVVDTQTGTVTPCADMIDAALTIWDIAGTTEQDDDATQA